MANSSSGRVAERKRHSRPVSFLIRLVKEKPLGTVGGVITVLLLITGIFANFLAPYGVNQMHSDYFLVPPSAKFWMGTDNMSRDVLSRVIFGARISVIIGLAATITSTIVGASIGILCGYLGGKVDMIVQRFVDAVMCFPGLYLLLVLMSVVGPGMVQLILVLGIGWGIGGSRFSRSAVIGIKENVYLQAAVSIGCPTSRIVTHHILPNIMAPIITSATSAVPAIILTEASLSYLGFGIPPPTPTWGNMISGAGRGYMYLAPWAVIFPGAALSVVVYGINMFGDALRDILDPRLRGGIGRYGGGKGKSKKGGDANQSSTTE